MKNEPTSQSSGGLSNQQLDAIKLIASGCTARYAALVLNVKYSVIKKWMSQDERFRVGLSQRIEALRENAEQESAEIKPKRSSGQRTTITKGPPG